jgi:L-threonylcarbamoyladenylate synthase
VPEFETQIRRANDAAIAEAARVLRVGGLVAFPTETVYGLGADAADAAAVARLYAAKGRPTFNPLIAHVRDAGAARAIALFEADAETLARAFWPGPLTLVLPQRPACPVAALATAGLDTIALRVPASAVAQDLLAAFGGPIVAPSANRSGHVSPTRAEHVVADLAGRVDVILDGGPTEAGLESTIVSCLGGAPALLRPGALAREEIEAVLGRPLATAPPAEGEAPAAPGQLASHYAPRAQLRLDAKKALPGEALLAFGAAPADGAPADAAPVLNLSPAGDLVEAAANLFAYLRRLDESGARTIAVMPIPHESLGEAINDRLRRAAAPR